MRYAFDFYGTLWRDHEGPNEPMVNLARDLLDAGYEVHVISHIPAANSPRPTTLKIESLGLPFTSVHVGSHGVGKHFKMRELGCDVILDDSPPVCQRAVDGGLMAINTTIVKESSE